MPVEGSFVEKHESLRRGLCLSLMLTNFKSAWQDNGVHVHLCACVYPGFQGLKWHPRAGASVGPWQLVVGGPSGWCWARAWLDSSPAHLALFLSTGLASVPVTTYLGDLPRTSICRAGWTHYTASGRQW